MNAELAQWTTSYINDLPDSCFAYIESGGEKDSDGKTTPRNLRHFPYKDASGKVDLPHLRNALARAPQSPFGDKALPTLRKAAANAGVGEYENIEELAEKAMKDLEAEVKLPFILKERILMSPGVWNNFYYNPEVVQTLFKKTNWDDVKVKALFLDHVDDRAAEWIGEVANPKFNNGNIVGDIVVLDKPTAIKLAYGAKFGISPKVIGEADYNRKMYDGHFENFSIVINPAVKTAYLNSEIKTGGKNMPKDNTLEIVSEASDIEEAKTKTSVEEFAEKVAAILQKKKPDEKKPFEYPQEMKEEIAALRAELEEIKKKPKEPDVQPCAEVENKELSEYTGFIKNYLKEHAGASIKDAAVAWGKEKGELAESPPAMSVEDLKTQVNEAIVARMSEFGVKPIKVASKFIDPKDTGYSDKVNAEELDREMFEMIKQGVGV